MFVSCCGCVLSLVVCVWVCCSCVDGCACCAYYWLSYSWLLCLLLLFVGVVGCVCVVVCLFMCCVVLYGVVVRVLGRRVRSYFKTCCYTRVVLKWLFVFFVGCVVFVFFIVSCFFCVFCVCVFVLVVVLIGCVFYLFR